MTVCACTPKQTRQRSEKQGDGSGAGGGLAGSKCKSQMPNAVRLYCFTDYAIKYSTVRLTLNTQYATPTHTSTRLTLQCEYNKRETLTIMSHDIGHRPARNVPNKNARPSDSPSLPSRLPGVWGAASLHTIIFITAFSIHTQSCRVTSSSINTITHPSISIPPLIHAIARRDTICAALSRWRPSRKPGAFVFGSIVFWVTARRPRFPRQKSRGWPSAKRLKVNTRARI